MFSIRLVYSDLIRFEVFEGFLTFKSTFSSLLSSISSFCGPSWMNPLKNCSNEAMKSSMVGLLVLEEGMSLEGVLTAVEGEILFVIILNIL